MLLSNTSKSSTIGSDFTPASAAEHPTKSVPSTSRITHSLREARESRCPLRAHQTGQVLIGSGDIDPGDGVLTVRLDPLPTARATAAIAELCEHLTATQTRYPGTDLVLRYEVKARP